MPFAKKVGFIYGTSILLNSQSEKLFFIILIYTISFENRISDWDVDKMLVKLEPLRSAARTNALQDVKIFVQRTVWGNKGKLDC